MLRLGKYHGLGNDFLVALESDNPNLTPDPITARELCDRHRGVGADGLIFGLHHSSADLEMVLINSDGSPAEVSGNGIRCLVHAFLRASGSDLDLIHVETLGGLRTVKVVGGETATEMVLEVDMGAVSGGPSLTPESSSYPAHHVGTFDIGNPHLVLAVESPDQVDVAADGAALEAGYSTGMNVHFVSVRSDGDLELRVWERGAGVTEACGSGAAAAVAAATEWGLVQGSTGVHMPGGTAVVDVNAESVMLTGPSVFVAEVNVP